MKRNPLLSEYANFVLYYDYGITTDTLFEQQGNPMLWPEISIWVDWYDSL